MRIVNILAFLPALLSALTVWKENLARNELSSANTSLSFSFSPSYSNSSKSVSAQIAHQPLSSFKHDNSMSSLPEDKLSLMSSKTPFFLIYNNFPSATSRPRTSSSFFSFAEDYSSFKQLPSSSAGNMIHPARQNSYLESSMRVKNPSEFALVFPTSLLRLTPKKSNSFTKEFGPVPHKKSKLSLSKFKLGTSSETSKKSLITPRHAPLEEISPLISDNETLSSNSSKKNGTKSSKLSPPTNVVKEVPTLDVGPLTVVTVSKGDTARLPCQYQSSIQDDTVRLVLWYRNETSRPLLSYDARDRPNDLSLYDYEKSKKMKTIRNQNKKRSVARSSLKGGRIFLTKGGSVLIVKETKNSDQAEYRCTVHYKKLPAVTFRLQLVITDTAKKVELFDSSGQKVSDEIGPLSEGSKLALTCKTHYNGKLIDLKWLVEGEVTTASRVHVGNQTAEIDLHMIVERRHAHATVTCRLICNHSQANGGVMGSIVDTSTTILLFYVPQATLLLDESTSSKVKILPEGGVQGGGNVEIGENQRLKFTCAVRARPPPYNITWLLNGRVLSSGVRRRVIGDSFLEIFPVERSDSGVYACLASNTEGDGHSNAIMVTVNHAPYCVGPLNRQVVIVRNSTVTLSCTVESNPPKVTFTWRVNHNKVRKPSSKEEPVVDKDGGVINGEHRFKYVPQLIDLVPVSNNGTASTYAPVERSTYMAYGPSLPHAVDPEEPTRSLLRITPGDESLGIVCFAKNIIGRMRVPCSYNIIVIDPLTPLQLCSVVKTESTTLEVACSEYPQGTEPVKQHLPGPSYVRSPDAKTVSTMEVWSMGTLLANVTGNHPRWVVQGLPSDTNLRLALYNVSPHTQSEPVLLYTRTKARTLATTQEIVNEDVSEHHHTVEISTSLEESEVGSIDEVAWIMGIVAGVVGLLLVAAALVGVIILRTTKFKYNSADPVESEIRQTAETDDTQSDSAWESPALLIKIPRQGDNAEFIEKVQSPIGEDCKLIESEEMQEIHFPPNNVNERGIT